jgi:hypothetical protein
MPRPAPRASCRCRARRASPGARCVFGQLRRRRRSSAECTPIWPYTPGGSVGLGSATQGRADGSPRAHLGFRLSVERPQSGRAWSRSGLRSVLLPPVGVMGENRPPRSALASPARAARRLTPTASAPPAHAPGAAAGPAPGPRACTPRHSVRHLPRRATRRRDSARASVRPLRATSPCGGRSLPAGPARCGRRRSSGPRGARSSNPRRRPAGALQRIR